MIRSALETLISVPSVSQDAPAPHIFGDASAEALDRMLEIADKLGFETENHDYYCGSVLMPGEDPSDEIGIIAHLDVVPAVEGWRYPRFALTVENGHYIGRGVRDDKGPAVAALAAMYFFKEKHIRLPFTVRLLLGCDEERGMGDLPHFLASHAAPRVFYSQLKTVFMTPISCAMDSSACISSSVGLRNQRNFSCTPLVRKRISL